jgi:hypothetical protein
MIFGAASTQRFLDHPTLQRVSRVSRLQVTRAQERRCYDLNLGQMFSTNDFAGLARITGKR